MKRMECPICRSLDSTPALWEHPELRRCYQCTVVYQEHIPPLDVVQSWYSQEYPYEPPKNNLGWRLYYRLFRRLPVAPPARVLDVGCGNGSWLLAMRRRGYTCVGIEPNQEMADRLRHGYDLDIHTEDLTHGVGTLASGSFDVITFWWTLEHMRDPIAQLRWARHLLKPGGHVIVALQNFDSIGRWLFKTRWHHLRLPTHLYQFNPHSLHYALGKAGFSNVKIRHDCLANDIATSLGFHSWLAHLCALPVELFAWVIHRSGLITATGVAP
jgi:2-polyprenyl-3-methyl-5-hydroxy-6-metoxy-1,4-benzoquinol methylase